MSRRWIAVAALALVVVPGAAIATSSPLGREQAQAKTVVQDFDSGNILTPVDDDVNLSVRREGSATRLEWTGDGPWRADVFYRVYRYDGPGRDTDCLSSGDAWYCYLSATPIATTRDLSYIDPSAPATATYRIGVGTNWIDDPEAGDVFAFSPPAAVTG